MNAKETKTEAAVGDALLNRKQVAKRLNLQPHTLAVWSVRRYGPPVTKIGSRAMYHPADVEAYVSAQRGQQ